MKKKNVDLENVPEQPLDVKVCPHLLLPGPAGDGPAEWPGPPLPAEAPFPIPDPRGARVAHPAALLESPEGSEGGMW